jgi:hypothetical protein
MSNLLKGPDPCLAVLAGAMFATSLKGDKLGE